MYAFAKPQQTKTSKNTVQKREKKQNLTGIPDTMKMRFENKSGLSFDDVRVHYNSDKPAQFQALAFTQGNRIYVAPGQEKHLGHELGHVVQQKMGIVKPTGTINGVAVNTDASLEKAADSFAVIQKKEMPINGDATLEKSTVAMSIIQRNRKSDLKKPLDRKSAFKAGLGKNELEFLECVENILIDRFSQDILTEFYNGGHIIINDDDWQVYNALRAKAITSGRYILRKERSDVVLKDRKPSFFERFKKELWHPSIVKNFAMAAIGCGIIGGIGGAIIGGFSGGFSGGIRGVFSGGIRGGITGAKVGFGLGAIAGSPPGSALIVAASQNSSHYTEDTTSEQFGFDFSTHGHILIGTFTKARKRKTFIQTEGAGLQDFIAVAKHGIGFINNKFYNKQTGLFGTSDRSEKKVLSSGLTSAIYEGT